MASNKAFNFGPLALTGTYTTNILNPDATSGGVNDNSTGLYIIIRKLRVINKTAVAATFRLYKGASGGNVAGTELAFDKNVPANDYVEIFGLTRLDTTDFLVGGASAGTTLTIEGEGEVGVA